MPSFVLSMRLCIVMLRVVFDMVRILYVMALGGYTCRAWLRGDGICIGIRGPDVCCVVCDIVAYIVEHVLLMVSIMLFVFGVSIAGSGVGADGVVVYMGVVTLMYGVVIVFVRVVI